MFPYARGSALIEHHKTGEQFEIHHDELDWEPLGGEERGMGVENIYEALIEHDELGELRWTISEYPVGAESFKSTDVGVHLVIEDFDYGLERKPEFDDDDPENLRNNFKNNPEWTKGIGRAEVARYLVDWFHYFYEDPANETPYNSREGGYLYIKGGPYSAEEELRENFEDVVPEDAILEAVNEIESDGLYDWAPSNHHLASVEFYEEAINENDAAAEPGLEKLFQQVADRGLSIRLGSKEEKVVRAKVLEQIDSLKNDLPKPVLHGGIGHNHPPQEFALQGEDLTKVSESLDSIQVELTSDAPDVQIVAQKATLLVKVLGWLAAKSDKTLDAFCDSFGKAFGTAAGAAIPVAAAASIIPTYWGKLAVLLGSLKDWFLLPH